MACQPCLTWHAAWLTANEDLVMATDRPEEVYPRPLPKQALGHVLPRKEVIQPQLPLRLPCYDFVPITSPTFDTCLPEGLAQWLQVLPAFMT